MLRTLVEQLASGRGHLLRSAAQDPRPWCRGALPLLLPALLQQILRHSCSADAPLLVPLLQCCRVVAHINEPAHLHTCYERNEYTFSRHYTGTHSFNSLSYRCHLWNTAWCS